MSEPLIPQRMDDDQLAFVLSVQDASELGETKPKWLIRSLVRHVKWVHSQMVPDMIARVEKVGKEFIEKENAKYADQIQVARLEAAMSKLHRNRFRIVWDAIRNWWRQWS